MKNAWHQTWIAGLFAFLFSSPAWAGQGYLPFHFVACSLEGLSEGHLGALIAAASLLVGAGLYLLTKNLIFAPISIAIALVLYFTPIAINDFFGISVQACSLSQAVTGSMAQQNFQACVHQVSTTERQTGEYCTCDATHMGPQSPSCESYQNYCSGQLSTVQTSYNYCTCSNATGQNSDPQCTTLAQTYSYASGVSGGNPISMSSSNGQYCLSSTGAYVSPGYGSCINYSGGTFSGCLNISGTSQVGYVCGGNSGICGSGNSIIANSAPPAGCGPNDQSVVASSGTSYPKSTQIASGGPITYQNGQFSGAPIQVLYLSSTGRQMTTEYTANGTCLVETLNGSPQGEYCP
ncbi:hypothetical protein JKG47_03555 [Acidithiobacillus sp. MC6.1]|nr:hypothetical protein [Acidithiobacillus sp. MC6.1]